MIMSLRCEEPLRSRFHFAYSFCKTQGPSVNIVATTELILEAPKVPSGSNFPYLMTAILNNIIQPEIFTIIDQKTSKEDLFPWLGQIRG
jgi:hypothetical protein